MLHFLGWPDMGIPEEHKDDFMVDVGSLIDFLHTQTSHGERMVVHCCSGIGRTGTTVVIAFVILDIKNQLDANAGDFSKVKFSIFRTTRLAREYRMCFVEQA